MEKEKFWDHTSHDRKEKLQKKLEKYRGFEIKVVEPVNFEDVPL